MALSLVTAPTSESLTLAEAKLHLRQPIDDDDALIAGILIPATRERGEAATRRQWITATWDWTFDRFPYDRPWLEVPKPPLVSVTSITYLDTSGTLQTWSSALYVVDAPAGPRCRRGRIAPIFGVPWPVTLDQLNAVTVRFVAGYGSASAVPARLKAAQLLDLGTLYGFRENIIADLGLTISLELQDGCRSIYSQYRSLGTQ